MKRKYLYQAGILFLLVLAWTYAGRHYGLFYNRSESLDGTLFFYAKGVMPSRGDLAVFEPPANPFHKEPFLKFVGGVAGDLVEARDGVYVVAGHEVGRAKEKSQKGVPLAPGPTGIIGEGQFFFYGTHRDSFDSRYQAIGWVDRSRIIGRAWRLF